MTRAFRHSPLSSATPVVVVLPLAQRPGSLVVVGNAPTALFRLIEMLNEGAPRPAAVIGIPVGFIGAAESKEALARDGRVPYLVVYGRRGGSAMAAAAVNALANPVE